MAKGKGDKDLKMVTGLALLLLVLMVFIGMIFVFGETFKEQLCTDAGLVYNASASTSNCNTVDYVPITKIVIVETAIGTLLGFLGLIILIKIISILIKIVKGVSSE